MSIAYLVFYLGYPSYPLEKWGSYDWPLKNPQNPYKNKKKKLQNGGYGKTQHKQASMKKT